jgi:hypothetical protein
LDEWAVRIMGTLMNLNGNLGIPLIPTSNIEVKNLLVEGMEFLLAREQREIFVKVHEESTNTIREHGFLPGSGSRSKDYVPFYFECPKDECHRSRTELVYHDKGADALLRGTCPTCGDAVEIETDSREPDLKEYAELLSPRVDSRQIILDKVLPVLVHVGGAGETAYYAQVIPVSTALDIPFPSFIKYPRAYFNTPYSETLADVLAAKEIQVLHQPELFRQTGKANKARRKENFDGMNESWKGFEEFLFNTFHRLNRTLDEIKIKLDTPEGKSDSNLVDTRLEIERYPSWVFGQYTEGKIGQESTWSWIDWAINSGLHDLFGPYQRTYVPEMKNGGTVFINFMV